MTPNSLPELERDVARDLKLIAYPENAWVPARQVGEEEVLDVFIVGGGQGGLAVASGLLRERITRILVVDEKPEGQEGIWTDFARMLTLRTPKHIGGPDLGIPSLTFQAWFEAQHGAQAFGDIKYIPKDMWQAYLLWFRKVLGIPVLNGVRFIAAEPVTGAKDGLLRVTVEMNGARSQRLTRKLVLAHGIDASGLWWMPDNIAALPKHLRAHASEPIDFAALKGKRVAVIGAAASAFDNAATALEAGAAHVQLFSRREELQRVQPYKVLAYQGFLRHFGALPDDTRWRMMSHLLTTREALTRETWERVTRHKNFSLLTGAPVLDAVAMGQEVQLKTPKGTQVADFVICGTGFETDLGARPELAGIAPFVATWADRYQPPEGLQSGRLGRYPYLDAGMAFVEKMPGTAPWVNDITCFNFGGTMSFGPSGSSISAMKFAVPRVVHALSRDLFAGDIGQHEATLVAYDTPEFDLVFARDR